MNEQLGRGLFFKDKPVVPSLSLKCTAGIFKHQHNGAVVFHRVIFWVTLQLTAHLSIWLISVTVRGQMEYFKIKSDYLTATEIKI